MNRLPEKLVKLRKHYSYSQSYIAELLGIEVLVYMSYENGSSLPKFDELKVLARFYEVPLETLFINNMDLPLEEDEVYDIDKENYQYLQNMAKKEKLISFLKQNKIKLIAIAVVLLVIIVVIALIPSGSSDLEITRNPSPNDLLSASDTSVVYIDNGTGYGQGYNINSQLDLDDFIDIVAIAEGDTFTVGLKSDGTVVSAGLISRYSQEVEALSDIVAIAAGSNHIVALASTGEVTCIGYDTYGQCEIDGTRSIVAIFADSNGTIAIDNDGNILSYGSFYGFEEVTELDGLIDIAISDEISVFVDSSGTLHYYSSGETFEDASNFTDIIQVAVGDNFIAVLDSSGNVSIDTDDENIDIEEVIAWENVSAIAAGKDYLVALIDGEIVGVGNNTYGQFDSGSSQMDVLNSVSNVKTSIDGNYLVISFDEVENATAYELIIIGLDISVTSNENSFTIAISQFVDGVQYTIQITAIGDGENYQDSDSYIFSYLFSDPTVSTVTLGQLVGLTVDEFLSYLRSLGVSDANLIGLVDDNVTCSEQAIITKVEGISYGQQLTLDDLLSLSITYYYCELSGGENNVAD